MKIIKVITENNKKYEILIKFNLFKYINIFKLFKKNSKIMFITNKYIYDMYSKYIINNNKKEIKYDFIIIPDGESSKSIVNLNEIITTLIIKEYNKNSLLIALGGGVIGDLTGFIASIYLRGIKYIQIPTTLLSQVDSSIGGKTGINHALGKNMIGSFYQPKIVYIDLKFLYSLSKRDFLSGISEIIKYSISLDYKFFIWLEKNIEYILKLNKKKLTYCINKCCELKTNIINKDEKDTKNIRYKLNFGHTYGHAIESFIGYGNWSHGEAVSAGIIMASKISTKISNLSIKKFNRIKNLIIKTKLPLTGPKNMKSNDYITYMKRDKKNDFNNKINLILIKDIGKSLIKEINIDTIKKSIDNIL